MDSKRLLTVEFPQSGIGQSIIEFFLQILRTQSFSVDGYKFDEFCLAVQPCEYVCLMGAKIWTERTGQPFRLGMMHKGEDKTFICCPDIGSFYRDYLQQKSDSFNHWEYAILKAIKGSQNDRDTKIVIVDNAHTLRQLKEYVLQTGVYCFDWETTGLDWFRDDFGVTVLSVSFQAGSSYVLPFDYTSEANKKAFYDFHSDMMSNDKIIKVAHNAAYDLLVNRSQGIFSCSGPLFDTMLLSHTLDENRQHGLKELIKHYFPSYAGYAKEGEGWKEKDLIKLAEYAGTDTDLTIRLFYALKIELYKDQTLTHLYHNSVIPDLLTLVEMQWQGMPVDEQLIDESIIEFKAELEKMDAQMMAFPEMMKYLDYLKVSAAHKRTIELEEKIPTAKGKYKALYEAVLHGIRTGAVSAFKGFNIGSPKQLSGFLFSKQGLNLPPMMLKGELKETTNKDALQEVNHPFTKLLTARRSVAQMISTFMEGLKKQVYKGRVYSSFNIHTVATGRLSSSKPNLQNIPARTDSEFEVVQRAIARIKQFFVPAPDQTLFQFDYSQAELRIIAHYAQVMEMIKAYSEGKDLHALTASNSMGITLEDFYELAKEIQKQKRHHAKGTNFGLIYGQSPEGYQNYLKLKYGVEISLEEATTETKRFFSKYPEILQYHKETIKHAEKYGYVTTLFGRRRRLPEIHSRNGAIAAHARNAAVNAPIQGTAGEFMRMTLTLLRYRGLLDCLICNTVHDSLMVLLTPENEKRNVKQIIYTAENLPLEFYWGVELSVKMKMDVEASKQNWGQLSEYKI